MWKRLISSVMGMTIVILSTSVGAGLAQGPELPFLTEPGPYGARITSMTFVDESRGDWELEASIIYPADKTQGTVAMTGTPLLRDAPPDRSGAPYPLIIYSHGWTLNSSGLLEAKAHLVSQGFVVVSPQHHDTSPLSHEFVDRPLDILLVLNELAAIAEGDLAGMIDTNNVGLMGFSQGGDAVLQMVGLLNDPVYRAEWCATHPEFTGIECTDEGMPLEVTNAYRAQLGLEIMPNGTWAPFGDERIHAVLAIDPCDFPLTNDDSLTAVTTPVMIVHGTTDGICDYQGNAVRTYTHLGTEDRYLLSLNPGGHTTFRDAVPLTKHFPTAFFGYYLKHDDTFAPYLSAEHLPDWPFPRLVWGPYEAE